MIRLISSFGRYHINTKYCPVSGDVLYFLS
nr:MAG TPA: hypothetical protein [Caudoviricetes sp.]